jgi:hypothetical protein
VDETCCTSVKTDVLKVALKTVIIECKECTVYQCCWHLSPRSEDLAKKSKSVKLTNGAQQIVSLLVTFLDGCKWTVLPSGSIRDAHF